MIAVAACELDHLDRGESHFSALVAIASARASQRLIDIVRRQHAERDRDARIMHDLAHSVGHAAAHIVEMRRPPSNHGPERDDRVEAPRLSEATRRQGNLEGTWNPVELQIRGIEAMCEKCLPRTLEQSNLNELIEARNDQRNA